MTAAATAQTAPVEEAAIMTNGATEANVAMSTAMAAAMAEMRTRAARA